MMQAKVEKTKFAQLPDGTSVDLFTLTNANGLVARITNFGTILTELHVPDRDGKLGDVVLGFDNLEQYLQGHPYFGCTVGRVANRIAKGKFTLEGRTYQLAVNNGPNHLHGGLKALDKVVWQAECLPQAAVKFNYTSPDGEEGYPGTVDTVVTMTLTDGNEFTIDYTCKTDKITPINLTNHSYFNLAGTGEILRHDIMISADYFTPADANQIPTGEITPVRGTSMDFTSPKPIGSRFSELRSVPVGYDHNYVVNRAGKGLALAARVYESTSGRVMEVHTTQPGVQFYTGNYLDGSLKGKRNTVYRQHSGFCLETQHYPDSVNHPSFPTTLLRPGQLYQHTTVHRFMAR
jgi:aldose 1-epimerase